MYSRRVNPQGDRQVAAPRLRPYHLPALAGCRPPLSIPLHAWAVATSVLCSKCSVRLLEATLHIPPNHTLNQNYDRKRQKARISAPGVPQAQTSEGAAVSN